MKLDIGPPAIHIYNFCNLSEFFWMRWIFFFNLPNPSSRTMALGSTQPLTEMSTKNLPGGKKRPARRADNLAAICELNV
jgi:hypothetical protein